MNTDGVEFLDVKPADEDTAETLVAAIADEFTQRLDRGEKPRVEEYARRYPALSGVLHDVLPALQLMHVSGADVLSGSEADRVGPAAASMTGCLGDFRILREVGRGGMGVVYEAEQISLGRQVALKVLPFAAALDAKHLQRFKREAQAAAHLHHSHIVPVYSVGCERGVYYYAMQFIEGQSLADVIDQLHRETGQSDSTVGAIEFDSAARTLTDSISRAALRELTARQGVSPGSDPAQRPEGDQPQTEQPVDPPTATLAAVSTERSVLGSDYFRSVALLGVQAAEALEHAHSLGIVHRDVKPANLLVDTSAHLFVTDFGLAQFQAEGNLTLTGDLVGTLRYMSPEQALLNEATVDHRTDIYSLGATLYELLTLRPLWNARDHRQLLRKIAFDDPVAPRKLNSRIPADLETILLKALAKEPRDRYRSAAAFADDLRRYLEHKTILARKPTLVERATKWSRRHRTIVVSAIVLLVMAVAALSVSNVLIARARSRTNSAYTLLAEKQQETKAAYEAEALQRERAERNFRQARQMLDFFVQVSEEELDDTPEVQDVRKKLLEASLGYYQEFLKDCGADPSAQAQLAASLFRLASVLNEIGAKPDALAAFEQAREVQEKLAREHPDDPEIQRGLFSIYRHMGVLRGSEQLSLLGQESVREHLLLTVPQIEKIDAFAERRRETYAGFRSYRDKSREEMRALFERRARETQQELTTILEPGQLERLDQISLQLRGTQAFSSPDAAAAIGLTGAQVATIEQIMEDAFRAWREAFRNRHKDRSHREESRKRFKSSLRSTNDKLLSVLTAEQMAAWRALVGEPFNGDLRFHYRRRHRERSPDRDDDPHKKSDERATQADAGAPARFPANK